MIEKAHISRPRRLGRKPSGLLFPFESAVQALRQHAERHPGETWIDLGDGKTATYEETWTAAERLARGLFARGVDRGGRCVLMLEPGPALVSHIFAVQRLGAAPVLLDPSLSASVALKRARDVRSDVVVCEPSRRDDLEQENERVHGRIKLRIPGELAAEGDVARATDVIPASLDLAVIALTPATEGEPRAVILRQRQIITWANGVAERLDLGPNDVIAGYLPPFMIPSLMWGLLLPIVCGARSVIRVPRAATANWIKEIAEAGATVAVGTDEIVRRSAIARSDAPAERGAIRVVINTGEPIRQTSIRDFEHKYKAPGIVRPAYGTIEMVGAIALLAPGEPLRIDDHGVVASGRPLKGIEIAIVDDTARDLPPGTIGHVRVRGNTLFDGYFGAERMRVAAGTIDGWLETGDIGYLDDEGYVYVLGRRADVITLGNKVVLPWQVEETAGRIHNVEALAAIGRMPRQGRPNDDNEELVIVAEISASAKGDREQMRRISDNIKGAVTSSAKYPPQEVLLVEAGSIPRCPDGRIMYRRLRELVISGRLGREGAILHGDKVFISPLKR